MTFRTRYITLQQAAKELGVDEETVLMAALECRITLYGLINRSVRASKWRTDLQSEESPGTTARYHCTYAPLFSSDVGNILINGVATDLVRIDLGDEANVAWIPLPTEKLEVRRNCVLARWDDIQRIKDDSAFPEPEEKASNSGPIERSEQVFWSEQLQALITASERYWARAEEGESDTQPTNEAVSKFLQEDSGCEFSASLANAAASIIRPKWASKGRKPSNIT